MEYYSTFLGLISHTMYNNIRSLYSSGFMPFRPLTNLRNPPIPPHLSWTFAYYSIPLSTFSKSPAGRPPPLFAYPFLQSTSHFFAYNGCSRNLSSQVSAGPSSQCLLLTFRFIFLNRNNPKRPRTAERRRRRLRHGRQIKTSWSFSPPPQLMYVCHSTWDDTPLLRPIRYCILLVHGPVPLSTTPPFL